VGPAIQLFHAQSNLMFSVLIGAGPGVFVRHVARNPLWSKDQDRRLEVTAKTE
jgi:hypothetical protein